MLVLLIVLALAAIGAAAAIGLLIYTYIRLSEKQNASYMDNSEYDWGHNANYKEDEE